MIMMLKFVINCGISVNLVPFLKSEGQGKTGSKKMDYFLRDLWIKRKPTTLFE